MKSKMLFVAMLLCAMPAAAVVTAETALTKKACIIEVAGSYINGNAVTTAKVKLQPESDHQPGGYVVEFFTLNGTVSKWFDIPPLPPMTQTACPPEVQSTPVTRAGTCWKQAPKEEQEVYNAKLAIVKQTANQYLQIKVAEIQKKCR